MASAVESGPGAGKGSMLLPAITEAFPTGMVAGIGVSARPIGSGGAAADVVMQSVSSSCRAGIAAAGGDGVEPGMTV